MTGYSYSAVHPMKYFEGGINVHIVVYNVLTNRANSSSE